MGRHKLPYKMKKPNAHHKYWRYVLSMDPHRSEISTRTKVKYEAERIAKQAYWDALEKMNNCPVLTTNYRQNKIQQFHCTFNMPIL